MMHKLLYAGLHHFFPAPIAPPQLGRTAGGCVTFWSDRATVYDFGDWAIVSPQNSKRTASVFIMILQDVLRSISDTVQSWIQFRAPSSPCLDSGRQSAQYRVLA